MKKLVLNEKLMTVLEGIQNSIQLEPKYKLAYALDGNVATSSVKLI